MIFNNLEKISECLNNIEQDILAQIYFEKDKAVFTEQNLKDIQAIYKNIISLTETIRKQYQERGKQ